MSTRCSAARWAAPFRRGTRQRASQALSCSPISSGAVCFSSCSSLSRLLSRACTSACTTQPTSWREPRSVRPSRSWHWPYSDFVGGPQQPGRDQKQRRQQADPDSDAAPDRRIVVGQVDEAHDHEDRAKRAEARDHHPAGDARGKLIARRAECEEDEHREADEKDELSEHTAMPAEERKGRLLSEGEAAHGDRVPAHEGAQRKDESAEPGKRLARVLERGRGEPFAGSDLESRLHQSPKTARIVSQIDRLMKRARKTSAPTSARNRIRARFSSCWCSSRARRRARARATSRAPARGSMKGLSSRAGWGAGAGIASDSFRFAIRPQA